MLSVRPILFRYIVPSFVLTIFISTLLWAQTPHAAGHATATLTLFSSSDEIPLGEVEFVVKISNPSDEPLSISYESSQADIAGHQAKRTRANTHRLALVVTPVGAYDVIDTSGKSDAAKTTVPPHGYTLVLFRLSQKFFPGAAIDLKAVLSATNDQELIASNTIALKR